MKAKHLAFERQLLSSEKVERILREAEAYLALASLVMPDLSGRKIRKPSP